MNVDWTIAFLSPWWLALLAVLPFIVWQSVGSLSGLGPVRRWIAIIARCTVLALIAAALADMQFVKKSDRLCTLFVVDQSQSIPQDKSAEALSAVAHSMNTREKDTDLAGMIVFGKNARIEMPPAEYPRDRRIGAIGSLVDRQYSDIASGIKLALGSFPPDTSKRIVLFSDGNQNRGNALAQAMAAKQINIPLDVVPIEYRYDSEILVDKIVLPPDLKKGDTANLKIVIRSARAASGILKLNQVTEGESQTILEQRVVLHEGLNVLFRKQTIEEPNLYTYRAEFIPDADAGDQLARNNQASAFTYIRGEGRILFVQQASGQHQQIVDKLRQDNLAVTVMQPDQLRGNLAQLRQFDTVILANVPAEMLPTNVQEMIVANTHDLGAGLIMIGGPESFGAGGYIGSPIEKALPVDMEIKSTKIRGKGALVLVMHACEIPEGNYWQKQVAKLAIKMLGAQDECGLVYWGGQTSWLFKLQPVGDRRMMNSRIDRMTPGDMPDFDSSMRLALSALAPSEAMTKHMIIISDGDPSPPSPSVLNGFVNAKISVTTVAVASHGRFERTLMRRIAATTKGRYYEVSNPKALPQIYTKETRVVSRPLIYEKEQPWKPTLRTVTDPVSGLGADLPGIRGLVLTTPKPLADVPIASPLPSENDINPILAHHQYGLGKAVAFTSDTGEKWAIGWPESEAYAKFWSQLIRWSMRPGESENLSVSTQEQDGKVTVVVNAIDKASEYLNFIQLQGKLIRPDLETSDLTFRQTAPGKYEAQFDAEQSGSYFLRMGYRQPDGSEGFVSTGMNVSYPPEFRDIDSNRDLLENLALVSGGRVVEWDKLNETDFLRHDQAPSLRLQDIWPWLLLCALCLLLFDVGVRRIAVDPYEIANRMKKRYLTWRGRRIPETASATMERLKSRKAELSEEFQKRRYEPKETVEPGPSVITPGPSTSAPDKPKSTEKRPDLTPKQEQPDQASYTSRLMEAKRKVWEQKQREKEQDKDKPSSS